MRGDKKKLDAPNPLIFRGAPRFESPEILQHLSEQTEITAQAWGEPSIFGVSGWIVSAPPQGYSSGYARVSEIEANGFKVVYTPNLGGGRSGHVTIVMRDPVDWDQADLLNAAFGRGGTLRDTETSTTRAP